MGLLDDELAKIKRAFGLLGDIKLKNDPAVKKMDEFERKLYEKSLIYQSMKNAFTAPARAMRGELDPMGDPRSTMGEAMNVAGMAQLGGIPGGPRGYGSVGAGPARPRNALGQEIPPTQYELAHLAAQRNAALPVEQGGLGLPEGNTAMDRARAMGFDTDSVMYHGSRDSDKITKFTESNPSDWIGAGTYTTSSGEQASNYALYGDHSMSADTAGAPGVLPLLVNKSKTIELSGAPATRQQINAIKDSVSAVSSKQMASDFARRAKGEPTTWDLHNIVTDPEFSGREGLGNYGQDIFRNAGYDSVLMRSGDPAFDGIAHGADHYTAFSPSWYDSVNHKYMPGNGTNQLRSRFAAFDPMKRDSADLLASRWPWLIPLGSGTLAGLLALQPDEAQAK